MSNHKTYGQHKGRPGRNPSAYSSLAVPVTTAAPEDVYSRLDELAEGLIRKGYGEDYAMEKAAEMCEKRS